ncbi:MAG: UbiA family prenyltransferase [Chitinispirillaceae bacterium]
MPMLLFSLSVAAVYVLNQIEDYSVDQNNGGFPLLVKTGIKKNNAWWSALFYGLFSIISSVLYSTELMMLSCAAIVLGYVYCFGPFYFTGRPFFDFISNATGYGIVAFAAGWHIAGQSFFSASFFLTAVPYFLLMCAGSISSTIPDMYGDKMEGKITTAVLLGKMRAHWLAWMMVFAAAVVAFFREDWIGVAAGLAAFPWYAAYPMKKQDRMLELSYKIGGTALMIISALVYPVFIAPSGAILLCTWLYFRFRHGVLYPSLDPAGHASENL